MKQSPSDPRKILIGSLTVLVLTFLGSCFAYVVRVLFSRSLSIENYGLFYAILGLVSLIATYMDLGFGYAVVYMFPKYFKNKDYAKAWNVFVHGHTISFLMSIIVCTLLAIGAKFLAKNYFKVPGSEVLIYLFCFYLISYVILNSLTQIFSSMHKEKYYASITVSKWFFTAAIALAFILLGLSNVIFLTIALVLGHFITVVIFAGLFLSKNNFLFKNKIVWKKQVFSEMFLLALPALLETIVYTALTATDTFLLTLFRGIREVGIYNIIYPLASIPVILFNPINALILPLVSHLMEGEKEKLKNLITKIIEVVPFVGLYFALFTVLFPTQIVGIIFGNKWLGLAEIPLTILALGSIPILMAGILGGIALGMGRVKEKLKVASLSAIVFLSLNILLTWQYGILGTVATASAASIAICFLLGRTIHFDIAFKVHWGFYTKLLLFAGVAYAVVRLVGLYPQNWYQLVGCGLLYTIVYAALGYLLKVYDRQLLISLLPKKLLDS